jgi:anaphase-promoting complex subunit 1
MLSGCPLSSFYAIINEMDLNAACIRSRSFLRILPFLHLESGSDPTKSRREKDLRVVKLLIEEGFSDHFELRDELPMGLSLPLLEVLYRCRMEQGGNDSDIEPEIWSLIGRDDLFKNYQAIKLGLTWSPATISDKNSGSNSSLPAEVIESKDRDGVTQLEVTSSMLFPGDNRIREVGRLLRSCRPIYLHVPRAIEVSDHDYERKKQEKLLLLSRRILALPVGRGMLTVGNLKPVPAEPLPVPDLCLAGRVPPTNATLALDTSECPADLKVWPEFHNGVAAGLRLPLHAEAGESVSKITRTWIVYNRPSNDNHAEPQNNSNPSENNTGKLNHAHGGLLMALGMRGHLTALEMTDIYDYLTHGSITTTVGTLLGMAAK